MIVFNTRSRPCVRSLPFRSPVTAADITACLERSELQGIRRYAGHLRCCSQCGRGELLTRSNAAVGTAAAAPGGEGSCTDQHHGCSARRNLRESVLRCSFAECLSRLLASTHGCLCLGCPHVPVVLLRLRCGPLGQVPPGLDAAATVDRALSSIAYYQRKAYTHGQDAVDAQKTLDAQVLHASPSVSR